MSGLMMISDMLALSAAWLIAIGLRFAPVHWRVPQIYETYIALLPLALVVYLASGLYNHSQNEVEEFKQSCKATSIFYLVVFSLIYFIRQGAVVSRLAVLLAWVFSLALVPLLREVVRNTAVKLGLWGEPVVIFGNGKLGNEVAAYLKAHPRMGYNPVGVVDRRREDRDPCGGVKVIHDPAVQGWQESKPNWLQGVRTAIVVTPETSARVHEMLIDKQTVRFEQLILVSSAEKTSSLWVQPLDIGGILGLEVGQNLLNRSQLFAKRVMDLTLIILSAPAMAVLFGVVAAAIKLDDGGEVFYFQDRIGYGGRTFKMWKFRSMYRGAEEKLEAYLAADPERKAEYEVNHKLKDDPRVTRVGKFIRKLSIDELPQLINVLKGDMSLIGPRPFIGDEIGFYDKCYSLYTYVLPGMTGLWQISGRSNVSYSTRVSLDDYYLRNWSIWLDIHILIKTIGVVLRGRGSY
jgi:Undecaprenyl-phosphate galactose phosphotransferase WbaP